MIKLGVLIEAIDRVTAPMRSMMASVRRIAATAEVQRFGAAASGVQSRVRSLIGAIVSLTVTIAALGIAAGGVAGAALVAMVRKSADTADAAAKAAQRIGINIEAYQRLGYAADLAGSSQDELALGLTLFNKQAAAAARGNKAAEKNFRSMGISIKDQNGHLKSAEQLFGEVSDRFAALPDGARKSSMAMMLFGRSGANLIPTLNSGSAGLKDAGDEAQRLGLIIGKDAADASENFNDDLSRLDGAVTGVWNSIAAKLLPIITPLVERMTAWISSNRELVATRLGDFLDALPGYISTVRTEVTALYDRFQPLIGTLQSIIGYVGPVNAIFGLLALIIGGKVIIAIVQLGGALGTLGGALGGPVISEAMTFTKAMWAGKGVMAAFNATVLANPLGLFLIAVAAVAGAAYLIYRNWDAVGPFFKKLFGNLRQVFQGILDFIVGVFTLDFGRAWKGLGEQFEGWAGGIITLVGGIVDAVGAIPRAVKSVGKFFGIAGGDSDSEGGTGGTGGAVSRGGHGGGVMVSPSMGAASVPVTSRDRVDTGGTLHVKIDQDGRARVADAKPNDARMSWDIDGGMVMP